MVETDSRGRAAQSIAAQVLIPADLPFYGSERLRGFPITVRVSGNCQEEPITFFSIMAHELSHVVLYGVLSKEKDNEVYTDLAAMILGFSNVMKEGRKVVRTRQQQYDPRTATTTTTTFGYLSDENFDFAFSKIAAIRAERAVSKRQLLAMLKVYADLLSSYRKQVRALRVSMEYLDENVSGKTRKGDTRRLVELHGADHAEALRAVHRRHQMKGREIDGLCGGIVHYTPGSQQSLRNAQKSLDTSINGLKHEIDQLQRDLNIVKRNAGFFGRRKIDKLVAGAEADRSARR